MHLNTRDCQARMLFLAAWVCLCVTVIGVTHSFYQENMSMKSIPPWIPLLYSKPGVPRGIPIFLLIQNIECGHSLQPPRLGGFNVYPRSMFWVKIRQMSFFFWWNFHFLPRNSLCVLHRQVFVMFKGWIQKEQLRSFSSLFFLYNVENRF